MDLIKRLRRLIRKRTMKIGHNISDFVFRHDLPCEPHVYDAILHYHLIPIQKVENQLDCKVMPTLVGFRDGGGSVYRHRQHELERGRSGDSYHTFRDGKGAGDYSVTDFGQFLVFAEQLIDNTNFTRLCFYPDKHFIHCDYAAESPQFYISTSNGWQLVDIDDFLETVEENYK